MKFKCRLLILFASLCIASCDDGQWNLNKTIQWKAEPEFSILILRWRDKHSGTSSLPVKRSLDSLVLEDLRSNQLGEEAEPDEAEETDLHFVVAKDYRKALLRIIEILKNKRLPDKV